MTLPQTLFKIYSYGMIATWTTAMVLDTLDKLKPEYSNY